MAAVYRRAVLALSFALLLGGLAVPAASQEAQKTPQLRPIDFYYKLYPEYKVQRHRAASSAGTDVGHMGTLRNDTTVLARDAARRAPFEGVVWSNSYIGLRGAAQAGQWTLGYDVQALVDLEGSFSDNFRTRDAFVYAEHEEFGRLAVGQMDTAYKEAGDVIGIFGVGSSNFVSTSRMLSGTGWRPGGEASFHQRVNRSLRWTSPRWQGFNLMLTHSVRPVESPAPGMKPVLSAAALQWEEGAWYASIAHEVHRDWLALSGSSPTPPPAGSIRNDGANASSRDRAWRATAAWQQGPWRVGADLARLSFGEQGENLAGKFRHYSNVAAQATVELRHSRNLRLAASHARATAGSCGLSATDCSTRGLGGHQTSLGALYRLNEIASVFVLATYWHNRPASVYGATAQGADSYALALGLRVSGR